MANQAKTINQKGDLMSYRPDIKLLDATIRDGGLVNNFGFSDEFVKELYKTNIKSGVEYMEFGYKASKELFDVKEFGKWKFCDEEDIRAIVGENDSPLKLSVMADVGRCDFKKDILPKSESVIDMIRIATYTHQMPGALEMINYCHDMGYETTINIMVIVSHDMGVHYQITDRMAIMYSGSIIELGPTDAIFNDPIHPYTKMLVDSLPRVGDKSQKVGIPGRPPALKNPPPGCRFAARCPHATDRCRQEIPEFIEVKPGRFAACHLLKKEGEKNG